MAPTTSKPPTLDAAALRKARDVAGYTTNEQLAAAAGISPATLQRLIAGDGNPTLAAVSGVLRATGAKYEDLFHA